MNKLLVKILLRQQNNLGNKKQFKTNYAFVQNVKKEIENAVKELESKTDFKPDAPFDHVFGTPHQEIEGQRADFLADLAEFEKKGAASG